ncbi:MAG: MFS transporter [Candidatus Krumholzibacteriota bacterium]
MTQFPAFLQRTFRVRADEVRPVLLSALLFYTLMTSYNILKPIRDTMGLAGGVRDLENLFLFTLGAMALVAPAIGFLVRRFPRERFIPIAYRFCALNLAVFFLVLRMTGEDSLLMTGRVFYVWVSVFNLFVLSLFWAFMADGFGYQRSRRVFGLIAIGGTLGSMLGNGVTRLFIGLLGEANLVLLSILFLEGSVWLVKYLSPRFREAGFHDEGAHDRPVAKAEGGGPLAGISLVFRSSFLGGIAGYIFLYTFIGTLLYFLRSEVVDVLVPGRDDRTAMFADIYFWTNTLTLAGQLFLTGRFLRRFGAGAALVLLPLAIAAGSALLATYPTLAVLVVFEVTRRAGNYALVKPARETLFTLVDRNVRYKAKNFIDTFVYRGGDALGALTFKLLGILGIGVAGTALVTVPLSLVWGAVGFYLGRRQKQLAAGRND